MCSFQKAGLSPGVLTQELCAQQSLHAAASTLVVLFAVQHILHAAAAAAAVAGLP
jgi:hypothetical protein